MTETLIKNLLQSAENSFTSLRELYLSKVDKSDLQKTFKNINNFFVADAQISRDSVEDLAVNFFNLQQTWLRLDSIVKTHEIDPGFEFAFSELSGHFYAAESIFLEVLREDQSNQLKIVQSVRASQLVLTDLAAFIAKLAITGVVLEPLDKVLALNTGKFSREKIASGLGL